MSTKLTKNETIRKLVFERLASLEWDDSDLIRDAEERGVRIDKSRFSKYKKGKPGDISDETLLYICCRLCIPLHFNVGEPVMDGDTLKWKIPAYNELEALKAINKFLGK